MPWLSWLFWRQQRTDEPGRRPHSARALEEPQPTSDHERADSWSSTRSAAEPERTYYTTAQLIAVSVVTTAATVTCMKLYKTYFRRIPTVSHLKPEYLRNRKFYGYVTRVGDGDNFHLFHAPGGRLTGWGWLPGRRVQDLSGKDLKDQTMHVRIAGIDAPELAHFGRPAQPFGQEALDWLQSYLLHRYVRVEPYRVDQYNRVVASVSRRKWLILHSDVGLEMLKSGFATVYEAKMGSEFGEREEQYREAEKIAQDRGLGLWAKPGLVGRMLGKTNDKMESPREYKTRMAQKERGEKGRDTSK